MIQDLGRSGPAAVKVLATKGKEEPSSLKANSTYTSLALTLFSFFRDTRHVDSTRAVPTTLRQRPVS